MKEIIDEEKVSKYMNNDEAVIVMDKKDFENNYIHKDKIRGIIEANKWLVKCYSTNETTQLVYKKEIEEINFKISIYEDLLKMEEL